MVGKMIPVDVTLSSEMLRVAEEVRSTETPRVLTRDGEEIAAVVPLSPAPKRRGKAKTYTREDDEAFLGSAGSWKGLVDVDKFLTDVYENRRSSRPPVEL